jgi:hypothetical protein
MPSREIRTEAQARRAEKVVSLLEHKVKRGLATPEELERYRAGTDHLLFWDWLQPSYENYVPNQLRAEEARRAPKAKPLIARLLPEPPAVETEDRPPLRRREGRFAV